MMRGRDSSLGDRKGWVLDPGRSALYRMRLNSSEYRRITRSREDEISTPSSLSDGRVEGGCRLDDPVNPYNTHAHVNFQ